MSAEALELVKKAEEVLLKTDEHDEALQLAEEALAVSRQGSDDKALASSVCCIVNCYRAKAQDDKHADRNQKKSILVTAEKLVEETLAGFRERQNLHGEAVMLMCTANLLFESKRLPESKRSNKKRQDALACAEKALRTFQESGNREMEAHAQKTVASGLLALNEVDQALHCCEEAVRLFRELGDKPNQANALHSCCAAISAAPATNKAYDYGAQCAKQSSEIYRGLGLRRLLAWSQNYLGKWYLMMDHPRNALGCAKEAVQIFGELQFSKEIAESRSTLCRALVGLADMKQALRIARDGVKEFAARGDKHGEILALENLVSVNMEGDSIFEFGDLNEALESAERGVKLCQEIGHKAWEANLLHNLAQIALRMRDIEKALKAVTDSSAILDDLGEQSERSVILQSAIEILIAKGDGRAALEVAGEIRRITKDLGKKSREANAALMEAQVYHSLGQSDTALKLAQEAQAVFQQLNDKKCEGMCWSVIAEVRKQMGAKEDALRASRTTQALYQQAGDKRSQAYAVKSSAALFVANASDQEAVRSAHEALALARSTGEPKSEVEMLNLVAQATLNSIIKQTQKMCDEQAIYFIAQHEASAIRPAREAAALARKMGDKQMTGIATYSAAQCHAVAGRSHAAVNAAMEARDLFRQTWDRQGEAMSVLMLAESICLDGDIEQGREMAKEAQKLFEVLNDEEGIEKAIRTLRQIDEIAGTDLSRGAHSSSPAAAAAPAEQGAASKAVVAKLGISPEKAREMAKKVALDAIGGDEDEMTFDDGLMDVGLDSLAAIAFRESLSQASGINLPSTLVFDYPTLSAVVDFLVDSSQEMA
eukprot:TRINITY_DN88535_c0_g1_i1.p1 TRINITY_DN88535_c0_g1~~TRINITY_DN88535_c0_g1_i1.p1  ORF type:complete len:840 (+),score=223.75 TRINITY_DN88535_c0_g1_i1:42-2522(+)